VASNAWGVSYWAGKSVPPRYSSVKPTNESVNAMRIVRRAGCVSAGTFVEDRAHVVCVRVSGKGVHCGIVSVNLHENGEVARLPSE